MRLRLAVVALTLLAIHTRSLHGQDTVETLPDLAVDGVLVDPETSILTEELEVVPEMADLL